MSKELRTLDSCLGWSGGGSVGVRKRGASSPQVPLLARFGDCPSIPH